MKTAVETQTALPSKKHDQDALNSEGQIQTVGRQPQTVPATIESDLDEVPKADPVNLVKEEQVNDTVAKAPKFSKSSYKDYSKVEVPLSYPNNGAAAKEPSFPMKLHLILSNPEFEDTISWMPHGRSWRILKANVFEDTILPQFFCHCRLSSFMRQVNGWGFRRIKHGPDYNTYYNELFLRGMPHLAERMRRESVSAKSKAKGGGDDEPTPDLYKISEENPLPIKAISAIQTPAIAMGTLSHRQARLASRARLSVENQGSAALYPTGATSMDVTQSLEQRHLENAYLVQQQMKQQAFLRDFRSCGVQKGVMSVRGDTGFLANAHHTDGRYFILDQESLGRQMAAGAFPHNRTPNPIGLNSALTPLHSSGRLADINGGLVRLDQLNASTARLAYAPATVGGGVMEGTRRIPMTDSVLSVGRPLHQLSADNYVLQRSEMLPRPVLSSEEVMPQQVEIDVSSLPILHRPRAL